MNELEDKAKKHKEEMIKVKMKMGKRVEDVQKGRNKIINFFSKRIKRS